MVLKLSNAGNASLDTATATGTITDDDASPSLSIAGPAEAVNEGDSGDTAMTVVLDAASGRAVTVDYGVDTTSTATAGTDFADLSGTLTFAAGETSQTLTVSVTGDEVDEADETVVLKLSNAGNASLGTATATGTITDDDASPSLSIAGPAEAVNEGDSGDTAMTFTVALDAASGRAVTVDYGVDTTSTATAGTDFTDLSGTLTFAAGETSQTLTVTVRGDELDEANETVVLKLSNAGNASLDTATATGTITDDDASPSLSIAGPAEAVNEGDSGDTAMTFTVALDAASGRAVTVDYGVDTTSTATAGTDFTDLSGTLTFAAGETSQTLTVMVRGDELDEADETVVLKLSNAGNASLGTATATGTITDDDASPSLSITAPAAVNEGDSGDTAMTFTVTLDAASGRAVTVDYGVDTTSTATAGTDFTDLSGTLTFAAGETQKSILGQATSWTRTTRRWCWLSNAGNASLDTATATGTITDDDASPSLSIAGPAEAVNEGDSGDTAMTFTVVLDAASGAVTVDYGVDTTDGDGGDGLRGSFGHADLCGGRDQPDAHGVGDGRRGGRGR